MKIIQKVMIIVRNDSFFYERMESVEGKLLGWNIADPFTGSHELKPEQYNDLEIEYQQLIKEV
jgi:hypothetical protein